MSHKQQTKMIDIEKVSSAAFRTDPEGKVIRWNQAFAKRFPMFIEEIMEQSWDVQPFSLIPFERPFETFCEHAAEFPCKSMYLKVKEGIFKLCRIEERDDCGNLLAYAYIVREHSIVSEMVDFDSLIDVAKRVIDDLNMGILYIDCHLRVLKMNPMAFQLFHIPPDLWLDSGKQLDYYIPEDSEEFRIIHKIVLSSHPFRNYLVNWERNGELKHILLDSYPIQDSRGVMQTICILLKDVGNLVSLEQQIQRNDKLATVGKIAAGIAHEIRNPLTSIKGFLQIMHSDQKTPELEKYKSFTEVMLTEIERINGLVSELLMLSKPSNVKFRLVDISDIISNLTPIIQSQALLYNIELKVLTSDTPPVYADAEMIKQVFLNLMKNAIEAMPNGGTLTVITTYEPDEQIVCIDFQDTGAGIPYYIIDRIFDAFYTTKEGGTGLGLSICQRIVNDLGGTIRVSSKGFGSTFSVRLPTNPDRSFVE